MSKTDKIKELNLQVLDTGFQKEFYQELDEGLGETFEEIVASFMEGLESDEEFDDLYLLVEDYVKNKVKKLFLDITNELMEEE